MTNPNIEIKYRLECSCGQACVTEMQDANNVIVILPCVHCQDDIVNLVIKEKLKQKLGLLRQVLGMVKDELHTDTLISEISDKVKKISEKEEL